MALTQEELNRMLGIGQSGSTGGNPIFGNPDSNNLGDLLGLDGIVNNGDTGGNTGGGHMNGQLINEKWAKQNPDKAQGKLIEAQWQDFLKRYAPIEQELLGRLQNFDFTQEARDAGGQVAGAFDRQAGGLDRNLSRFGLSADAAQQGASQDTLERNRALGIAGAENMTRRGMRDRNLELMNIMAGHGKGIASSALSGMGQAGAMAAQRKQIGDQAAAANTQSMIGGAASGAMMGSAFGPPGMIVGALVGGLLGGI